MNLILFDSSELLQPLARTDARAVHVLTVLRRQIGDSFDAGVVNGPRGKARLVRLTDLALSLEFTWLHAPPDPPPLTLIVGFPRPQTARDILRDTTTLGVGALHFVQTEKSEPSYAQSTLWRSGEWQRQIRAGAEQAFSTQVPVVTFGHRLDATLGGLPTGGTRLALDNYEAAEALANGSRLAAPVTLCVGAERGWSAGERDALRAHGFTLVHLGARVLRTETACVAALTLLRRELGLL